MSVRFKDVCKIVCNRCMGCIFPYKKRSLLCKSGEIYFLFYGLRRRDQCELNMYRMDFTDQR